MALELVVVTPQGESFRGPVESVVLPGSEGDFGVLEHHERFLSPLRAGAVEVRTGEDTLLAAIATGFADVNGEEVTVLVESCELAVDIDVARAELALQRANEGLAQTDADGQRERYEEFQAAIGRAEARLAVAGKTSS